MKYDFNIVTQHSAMNYGASLQAYALKTFIQDMGYVAGIYKANIVQGSAKQNLKQKIYGCVYHVLYAVHKKDFEEKNKKFLEFWDKNFDLNNDCTAKVFLAGSDQVWHPSIFNPDFYLCFASKKSIKASYAASIGVSKIKEEYVSEYKKYLQEFRYISLREKEGQQEMSRILGKDDVRCDIDPSFLLTKEKWTAISQKGNCPEKEPFVFMYILHIPKNINSIVDWIRKETGYRVIVMDDRGYLNLKIPHTKAVRNLGPYDFLAYIREAKAVVTTSFHGTAFSIIFNKEFYSINNVAFPSRISNIMELFQILEISEEQTQFKRADIDFSEINCKIEECRNKSRSYIEMLMDEANERGEQ